MNIKTARVWYRGQDEMVLNTTAKSGRGVGAILAPTWDLVMGIERGTISSWDEYTEGYLTLMRERYRQHRMAFERLVRAEQTVVFCCYCQGREYCHRSILAEQIFPTIAQSMGVAFHDLGEAPHHRPGRVIKPSSGF